MISEQEKEAIQYHYKNISKYFSQFKYRKSQQLMIAEIAKVLGNTLDVDENNEHEKESQKSQAGNSILVVEGPTGVGKSLAYLLSGSVMAQFRKKHLIISSATIALQQQLIDKDLPDFEKASGLKITYTLAKGRSHYLCPYRLYQMTSRSWQSSFSNFGCLPNSQEEVSEYNITLIKDIAKSFQDRTFLGDRESWPEMIPNVVWNQINNDRHICLKHQCPNKAECPYFLIREEFDKTGIIVANHDLLLSDLDLGGGVLLPSPRNCFYCIDEAHHLPKKAVKHFTGSHSLSRGYLLSANFQNLLNKLNNISEFVNMTELLAQQVLTLDTIWNGWEYFLKEVPSDKYQFDIENKTGIWILNDEDYDVDFKQMVTNTAIVFSRILKGLLEIQAILTKVEKTNFTAFSFLLNEFSWVLNNVSNIEYVWSMMNKEHNISAPFARWIVRNKSGKLDFEFHVAPINVASKLIKIFWSKCAGAILTSATLKLVNSFDFILSRTGLNQLSQVHTLALESPFDFEKQAELYIPNFINTPKQADLHTQEIIAWFPKLVDLTSAVGTLFLFSSKKQMLDVYEHLSEKYRQYILVQGLMSKNQLIQQHIKQVNDNNCASIIFGLDSFAEGMDLRGDLCIHVIIAKIPFPVPDNPVDKVYCDWLDKRGGNSFLGFYIPEASIKLSQAVGRLIRSETDYGRITILDTRLQNSSYGKKLMASLPKFKII